MTLQGSPACPMCGAPLAPGARFCVRCGALAFPAAANADEIALSGRQRVQISAGALSLRELLAVVESGVFYWRQRLERADGVAREQAVAAIKDLSQILDNLATQIAQGRETIRITGRLPPRRRAPRPCPLCGRGNRQAARYCMACGAPLHPGQRAEPSRLPARRLAIAARTDRGAVRPVNEDTVYAGEFTAGHSSIGTLLVVADGMGGHQAGDVASSLAVATLKQALTDALNASLPEDDQAWHALLRGAVQEANRQVYAQARADAARRGMGTTLTVAVVTETRAHLAHVGDSRAYLLNPAGVTGEGSIWTQLTIDHTLVARLVDIGQLTPEQARVHPQRHMLYRSLGTDPVTEVDVLSQALAAGDVLVLCSDGLVNHVDDGELARIVLETPGEDLACERLIALANERGGQDNISVVIARISRVEGLA
ncbi:MAG: Stp1/IreP family PP2C-type Ser/Thr phosphatase [Chloroflexaceae bacterium]|nr:Stp1/IreP family PP2C-type Ser/Thr phosphatase [Chloroflexaceae bacterium]